MHSQKIVQRYVKPHLRRSVTVSRWVDWIHHMWVVVLGPKKTAQAKGITSHVSSKERG